jgi:putative PIN family toxin of toxin-antitoxin system
VRVVLDTNVLIRAHARSRTLARRLLHEIVGRGHRLILSNEMVAEIVKVLRYPKLQSMYGFTDAELLEYAQFLQSIADLVILDVTYTSPLRDPADCDVLQTAELGEVDILCTQDADFYDMAVLSFCSERGIEVCDEVTLAARLLGPAA